MIEIGGVFHVSGGRYHNWVRVLDWMDIDMGNHPMYRHQLCVYIFVLGIIFKFRIISFSSDNIEKVNTTIIANRVGWPGVFNYYPPKVSR